MDDDGPEGECWRIWQKVRAAKPLVQCITNDVAQDITANVLLAAGASPAMVGSPDECEHFAKNCASALLVNLGTLSSGAVASQRLAMQAALKAGKPVVLDPVACGATPYRTRACVAALELRPTVVRGNAGEILALAAAAGVWKQGGTDDLVRGVDSAVVAGDPRVIEAMRAISNRYGCVVAVSGEADLVVIPTVEVGDLPKVNHHFVLRSGVEMLTRVTAAGCSLTALIAAFVAVKEGNRSAHWETIAAMCVFGACAEAALERAERKGPGSLRVGLIDELHLMTKEEFMRRFKIAIFTR